MLSATPEPDAPSLSVNGGPKTFVFQTGEPRFRKYDANGTLLFERVIQGTELILPNSVSFTREGRVLITPGCYIFEPAAGR